MTDIDVIVLDIDGGAMLQSCVDALSRQTVKPRTAIVFDNGSLAPAPACLTGHVEIVRSETNRGFAEANDEARRFLRRPVDTDSSGFDL